MSLPPYNNYKNSGVEWLGMLPEHWEVSSVRRIAAEVTTGNTPRSGPATTDLDDGLPWYTPADFGDSLVLADSIHELPRGTVLCGEARLFPAGSVLIVSIGATLGKVGYATQLSSANQQINAVIPSESIDGHFLAYTLSVKSGIMRYLSNSSTIGIMNQDKTKEICLVVPPLAEQASITVFLDREIAKIDALVVEQQRLIALLREKRQAVISHAVTKGLNPAARAKDSGTEWLGQVPEHWKVARLGSLFVEAADTGREDLPVLSVSIHHGVSDREFDDNELERKITRSDDRTKYKRVQRSDLVYNMMRAWQGGFGTVAVTGMVSPAYVVARPVTDSSTEFIEYILRTPHAIEEMRRHSHGVTDFRLRLYWDEFKSIRVPLPPVDEQNDILGFLEVETFKLDALIAEAERAIALLQERRTALISAAVTGKIDVRGVAASGATV